MMGRSHLGTSRRKICFLEAQTSPMLKPQMQKGQGHAEAAFDNELSCGANLGHVCGCRPGPPLVCYLPTSPMPAFSFCYIPGLFGSVTNFGAFGV